MNDLIARRRLSALGLLVFNGHKTGVVIVSGSSGLLVHGQLKTS